MKSLIEPGRYRHYKGNEYQVIGTATHSESEETLVLYFPLYGNENETGYWVRPLTMFTEKVTVDGQDIPRFLLIEKDEFLED